MQVFWEEAGRQVQAFRTRVANAWREWREDVAARRRKRELARKAARERRQLAMRLKGATNVSDADSLRSALESGRDVVMGGQVSTEQCLRPEILREQRHPN